MCGATNFAYLPQLSPRMVIKIGSILFEFFTYLLNLSLIILGANGIQKSLTFINLFIVCKILESFGFAIIDLFPRALGPNSDFDSENNATGKPLFNNLATCLDYSF